MSSRREFLGHAGALGLGSMFMPFAATVTCGASGGSGAAGGAASGAVAPGTKVPGLVFEMIEAGGIAHYSYFIGDTLSGAAAVIDPKRDVRIPGIPGIPRCPGDSAGVVRSDMRTPLTVWK